MELLSLKSDYRKTYKESGRDELLLQINKRKEKMEKVIKLKYEGSNIYRAHNEVGKKLGYLGFVASGATSVYGDHLRYHDPSTNIVVLKGSNKNSGLDLNLQIYGPNSAKLEKELIAKSLEEESFKTTGLYVGIKRILKPVSDKVYNALDATLSVADSFSEKKVIIQNGDYVVVGKSPKKILEKMLKPASIVADAFFSAADYLTEKKVNEVPDLTPEQIRKIYQDANAEPVIVLGNSLLEKLVSVLPQEGPGPQHTDEVLPPLKREVGEPILLTNGRKTVDMKKLLKEVDARIDDFNNRSYNQGFSQIKGDLSYDVGISELDLQLLQSMDWSKGPESEIAVPNAVAYKGDDGTSIVSLDELYSAPSLDEKKSVSEKPADLLQPRI